MGNDSLFGGNGNDSLVGGDGDDFVSGGAGADTLDGGAGIDTVTYSYSTGNFDIDLSQQTAAGESVVGFENAIGSTGNNVITGNDQANRLEGLGGNDTLTGNAGNDSLYGGDGADSIAGGDGDDFVSGGSGADTLDGGAGIDTVTYDYWTGGMDIDLSQQRAGSEMVVGFENAIGSQGDNAITGDDGANRLDGLAGNDTLFGGAGDDTLSGGDGDDVFRFAPGGGHHVVTDFEAGPGGGDLVDLTAYTPFAAFADIQQRLQDAGADAVLTLDNGEIITFLGRSAADFDAGDFLFAV